MLAGEKPLSLFFAPLSERAGIPEADFAPHVRDGTILKVEKTIRHRHETVCPSPILIILYALPAERWRIGSALRVIEPVREGERRPLPEDDIEIGRLLGYAEEAVAHFVEMHSADSADANNSYVTLKR